MTASLAAGPSSLGREVHVGNDVRHLSRQAALGYSADATLYLRLVGIGLSVFGAASPDHGYNAVSLNISLGKIH